VNYRKKPGYDEKYWVVVILKVTTAYFIFSGTDYPRSSVQSPDPQAAFHPKALLSQSPSFCPRPEYPSVSIITPAARTNTVPSTVKKRTKTRKTRKMCITNNCCVSRLSPMKRLIRVSVSRSHNGLGRLAFFNSGDIRWWWKGVVFYWGTIAEIDERTKILSRSADAWSPFDMR